MAECGCEWSARWTGTGTGIGRPNRLNKKTEETGKIKKGCERAGGGGRRDKRKEKIVERGGVVWCG